VDNITLKAPIVGAAIDWLSMSCNRADAVAALFDWFRDKVAELKDEGYDAKPWGGHGYQGISIDGFGWGFNGVSCIIQLSGERARRYWRALAMESTNVSRIDLAVTIRPLSDVGALARDEYEAIARLAPRRGRPIRRQVTQGNDGGETLYIGSKKSDQLGRLYNKGVESRNPAYAGCWRYEVQYRDKIAYGKTRALLSTQEENKTIEGDVYRWFSSRGVSPIFIPGSGQGIAVDVKAVPDDERFLAWVRRCVQPRGRLLVKRYGWRFVAEACVGRITSEADWESLVRDVEIELQEDS
jgi:DNA relaxase NicK